ncbi:GYD domain-containing protein [Halomarina rubra]|uniref:GYD domain-containing protein n=1 Tax=Halomarina rubra TaxID=2071873 RepID=A0ABD6AWP7_9EURY|nr:GYD domain-containing protein [Halomarina rubra]
MPTYIVLADWTEQGMAAIDESPSRLDDARDLAESLGGEFREFYMTMGDHDMVAMMEMPDDDAMAKMALALGRSGNVTTETLKAFAEDEYRDVMSNLP